jgi:hypothetical protein
MVNEVESSYWKEYQELAKWTNVLCPPLKEDSKPHQIWLPMKRDKISTFTQLTPPHYLGLNLTVHVPKKQGTKIISFMIKACYEVARKVHQRQIELKKALDEVELRTGMGRGSALAYVNVLCCMLDGREYHRTINETATDYFLNGIKNDYSREHLISACTAAKQHVEYYYRIRGGRLKGIERIIEKYYPI